MKIKIEMVSPEVKTMLCDLVNQIEHEYSQEYQYELEENSKLSELWRKSQQENKQLKEELKKLKQPTIFIDTQDMEERYAEGLYMDYLKEENQQLTEKVTVLNQMDTDTYNKYCETLKENADLKKQLEYLRSGEYLNQLKFERNMLENIVQNMEISKEDKEFIDMTHRNTELLEENQELKDRNNKVLDEIAKDKMEQFDDYVIYLLEKYENILKEDNKDGE